MRLVYLPNSLPDLTDLEVNFVRHDDTDQQPGNQNLDATKAADQGPSMANGVMAYTDAAIDAYDASYDLISSVGGDRQKTREVARYLAKQGMRDVIQENMAHLNASGQTSHLASFPPVRPLEDPNEDRSGSHPTIDKLLGNLGRDDD